MERRHRTVSKASPLPIDFRKMVAEVFTTNFDAGLKLLQKIKAGKRHFEVRGDIFADEVMLCISLGTSGHVSATSVYASCDFDPKASAPKIEDVLGACVDAVGSVYMELLDPENPKRIEQIAQESLAALQDIPYEWTSMKVDRHKVFVRVDKTNPALDELADQWLKKHDPKHKDLEKEEQEEVESLFVTGPKGKKQLH